MHRLYMMHLLNHVLTARSRIQRHNRQLKDIEKEEEKEEDGAMKDDNNDDGRFRDQGFTRPTVLVLLPNKAACYHFVQNLFKLTGNEMDNGKNERFEAEYGDAADDDESSSDKQAERRKAVLEKKGKEWNELFGDTVNQDDDFKLGIQLTPKAAKAKPTAAKGTTETKKSSNVGIKVYSDFFKSDIILASPLGLKLLIAPDDEEEEGDYDYLSSIEICLVQYSDVLLMQNWDHVNDILALLNQEPQKNHNTDFSRVRNYLLEGQGDRWRQLIISSKLTDPFLSSAFKRFGKSLTGNVRMRWQIDAENASIANVLTPIKQVFQKVPVSSFDKQSECRVNYFVNSILPQILQQKHTMVYVPSYFDFCALRNVLLKREIPFVSVHEYSRTSEVTRGRARFLQGRKPLMLYTGRCNFFHRHSIKGARHLIFLGLPEHAEFYSDHVNQIETTRDDFDMEAATSVSSCLVLCTRFEALALERIVGSTNCARMLKSQKSTFMFYS
jgi:U3 small nucleolar RNA-associated protein 25